MNTGKHICIPREKATDKLRDYAIAGNGRPRPGRDTDKAVVPGVLVELAYPGVVQVTGGGKERGARQDKIGIPNGLQDGDGILGQPHAFENLPCVGL